MQGRRVLNPFFFTAVFLITLATHVLCMHLVAICVLYRLPVLLIFKALRSLVKPNVYYELYVIVVYNIR